MAVVVIILAAGYGVAAGLLLPRTAYRFSVEPGVPWRGHCPQGHPLRGWFGPARCPDVPDPDVPGPGVSDPGALGRLGPEPGPGPAVPSPGVSGPGVSEPSAVGLVGPGPGPDVPDLGVPRPGVSGLVRPGPGPGTRLGVSGSGAGARSRGRFGVPGLVSGFRSRGRFGPGGAAGFRPRGRFGLGGRAGGFGAPGHRYGPRGGRVAVVSGGVCAALAWAVGPRPETAVFAGLAPVLVLLALVDLAVHRLPDVLTLPLAAAAAAALGAAALLPGAAGSWRLALLGGAALGAAYLLLFLINPAGMGFGDVKLALALGVALGWYGWGVWLLGAFLGFFYGALYGLGLVLRSRDGRKQAFPFGPFMAAGALTGVLLGGFGA